MNNRTTVALVAAMYLFLLAALSLPAHAALSPAKGSKVSADLMVLDAERSATLRSGDTRSEDVVIDTAATGDPQALASDLHALGAKKVTVFGRMVSAILPTTHLRTQRTSLTPARAPRL